MLESSIQTPGLLSGHVDLCANLMLWQMVVYTDSVSERKRGRNISCDVWAKQAGTNANMCGFFKKANNPSPTEPPSNISVDSFV